MRVLAAWFLDLLVLATVATIGFVLASGGGTYDVFGVHLRLRSPDNAVTFLTVLLVVRYAAREWHPLFGLRRVTGSAIDVWFVHQVQTVAHVVRRPLPFAATLVLLMSVAACGVKAWLAASSPGFYSGDDVEIHEMTLPRSIYIDGRLVWSR